MTVKEKITKTMMKAYSEYVRTHRLEDRSKEVAELLETNLIKKGNRGYVFHINGKHDCDIRNYTNPSTIASFLHYEIFYIGCTLRPIEKLTKEGK